MSAANAEQSIFLAALELPTVGERLAYLKGACGMDRTLLSNVRELLAAHDKGDRFLDRSPLSATIEEPSVTERPGTVIGPYKLVEQIGEGGMGLVFVAEQQQPVRRKVALKVIKPGMDSRQVIARFEAERQALALMDHPNIAHVFDGGATPSGRPYFVMELVRGVPVTRFCDANRLTPRQRLELFVSVCQAVQHAHTKGVIHRDLKPGNVLVTLHDGPPVVKVIDFGIAKAIGPPLTDKTLFTGFAQLIGTPLYMSPEQAEMSGLDVDTRSDVYSLGVLLYELLTGTTPFDGERLRAAGYDEMRRIIREEEPARPSHRVSTLGGALTVVSEQRQTDPKKLSRLFRGEVDWIVMKALEKNRNRRYETASAFAQDVQRYLADEPVQAGPPGAAYRLRKFAKRHRGPVLAATVVLLALVAGIVGTTLGLVEARANAEKAKTARNEAQGLARDEKAARDRAEKQLLRAEWSIYAGQITLAQQAWENNNGLLALYYLDSCRPDFRGWEHDYLSTLFNSNQQTLRGHTGEVSSVAVSPDGQRIVSGSADGTVKVWDMATGQNTLTLKRNTLPINTGGVFSVAMSPDGQRIVSGHWDTMGEAMTVWDAGTGQKTWTLKGDLSGVLSVAFSPDAKRIVSASMNGAVKVWDADTGQEILTLRNANPVARPNIQGESKAVNSLAFSPDAKSIVGCDHDRTVKIWDADTGQETLTLKGHTGILTSVAVSPDGKHIVSGSLDKTVKVWDAATGQEVRTLKGHTSMVNSVALSPAGQHIVSGSNDGTLKIWDAATGQEIRALKGHTAGVISVAVSADGKRIVSGSLDKTVKVWDAAKAQEPPTLKGHTSTVTSVALSPDGKRIISGSYDKTVKVWDAATGQEERALKGHTGEVSSVALSPDGKRIISGSYDKTVKVWDAATGQETRTLKGHTGEVMSVAVSSDGQRIVSVSLDGTVKVWDATGGEETRTLQGYTSQPSPQGKVYVHCVALSPDAKRVAGGTNDGTVKVWDVATGQETLTSKGHTGFVTCVALSPDGQRLVSGGLDKTAKVWDAATGDEILALQGHTHSLSSVALMPDGKRIVTRTNDGVVKVWDAATGQNTLTLIGSLNFVNGMAVSPDGKRIVTGTNDGTVTVWDASMSQPKP